MNKSFKLSQIDWYFVAIVAGLIFIGFAAIYSSDAGVSLLDKSNTFQRQVIWFVLGIGIVAGIVAIPSRALFDFAYVLYAISIALLIYVLLTGKGTTLRWIQIFGFTVQPSEFAKIAVVIALSRYLSLCKLHQNKIKDLLIAFAMVAVPLYLIKEQPDLGTSLVLISILIPMLYWANVQPFTLFVIVSPFLSVISSTNFYFFLVWMLVILLVIYLSKKPLPVIIGIFVINIGVGVMTPVLWNNYLQGYQRDRILILLDPQKDAQGDGYQVLQSQNAIGSGGLSGKGFLQGTQTQLKFLPEQNTDFIFSVVGEEFGFVGISVVFVLFFLLLYRMIQIAANVREKFEGLIVIGFVSVLLFHVSINTGMTVGIMPVTGLPLPFLSYGGSFLLTCMAMMGIVLNISKNK